MKRIWFLSFCVAATVISVTGCEDSANKTDNAMAKASSGPVEPDKSLFASPIELTVFQKSANISDQEFDDYFTKGIEAKYPNIKFKLVHYGKGTMLEDLMASGNVPDIFFVDNGLKYPVDLGLAQNLTPYVKKYGLDLSGFNKVAIDAIKTNSGDGKLYALPFSLNWFGLFYNKDLFDKFGVPYPKDSMTWDDAIELAKRLTRKEDGVQYYGLDPNDVNYWASGLSLPDFDPKTGKAKLVTDSRKLVYDTMKTLFDIPGQLPDSSKFYSMRNMFLKDKTVAMSAYWGIGTVNTLEQMSNAGDNMNWDMVTSPNFKQASGTAQAVNLHNLMVSSTSKYKEQAFLVVKELVSKTIQMQTVRNARMSPLTDPELQNDFGANLSTMKGKNIAGIFKANPAPLPPYNKYSSIVDGDYKSAFKDVVYSGMDINTALREAEDTANKNVEDQGGNGK